MKNLSTIIVLAILFISCTNHYPSKEQTEEPKSIEDNVKQAEEVVVAAGTNLEEDDDWKDPRRNLTVIPHNISGNNSANVIRNAVKDVDGNSYDAVRIGKQVWMQTDLRTKHYQDGSAVPHQIHVDGKWNDNDFSYTEPFWAEEYMYGELCLYNWPAVSDPRGLCPDGWRVATKQDWDALETYLGADTSYVKGDNPKHIAKALSSAQWPDWPEYEEYLDKKEHVVGYEPTSTNNATGFSAFPWPYFDGRHYGGIIFAAYWTPNAISKSKAWAVKIHGNGATLNIKPDEKGYYYMVRCVRQEQKLR